MHSLTKNPQHFHTTLSNIFQIILLTHFFLTLLHLAIHSFFLHSLIYIYFIFILQVTKSKNSAYTLMVYKGEFIRFIKTEKTPLIHHGCIRGGLSKSKNSAYTPMVYKGGFIRFIKTEKTPLIHPWCIGGGFQN